ncbi:Acylphosphatase [Rubrobacter radiotolerans]|uniref:Acylphosphatase n=1 Tax=Rubrobacter radiotolerans TaxID=42256 RepID=A0A023X169_RUBRA|nr:acylphosphatase [Rubrobacter radiotolerans]AHY45951.1 Acylphosphatase [Rubrobacter radiotolerans]MDX5893364.1 acylphosphatase [Rubrobacter radiotolerans]SMC03579.1 acylphosphatase [Rubrobacter radiotolerans DSM 5868]
MKRAHVYVSGEVQGVFFRDSARSEAEDRGVSGWVQNLPDGRVEAVFEGEPEKVDEMVRWCKSGPAWAKVTSVEVDESSVSEGEVPGDRGFEVR